MNDEYEEDAERVGLDKKEKELMTISAELHRMLPKAKFGKERSQLHDVIAALDELLLTIEEEKNPAE